MTDKKLTDSEIVKALECCMDEMGCKKGCPCFDPKSKSSHCTAIGENELEKLALDLINRQQAEIDGLRADLKRACAEIDDAQICKYSFIASSSIIDFAERLRRKAVGLKLVNRDYRFVSVKEIDSLVIKMSGETHEW